jgi:hypothetical protein
MHEDDAEVGEDENVRSFARGRTLSDTAAYARERILIETRPAPLPILRSPI